MNTVQIILILSSMYTVALWLLVTIVFKNYYVDLYRQRLFGLRDSLFDLAVNGPLKFDDKIYGMTRSRINSLIRYAHHVNFFRVLGCYLALKFFKGNNQSNTYTKYYDETLNSCTPAVKKAIDEINFEFHLHILLLLIRSSWLLAPIFYVLIFSAKSLGLIEKIKNCIRFQLRFSSLFKYLDAEADLVGAN